MKKNRNTHSHTTHHTAHTHMHTYNTKYTTNFRVAEDVRKMLRTESTKQQVCVGHAQGPSSAIASRAGVGTLGKSIKRPQILNGKRKYKGSGITIISTQRLKDSQLTTQKLKQNNQINTKTLVPADSGPTTKTPDRKYSLDPPPAATCHCETML